MHQIKKVELYICTIDDDIEYYFQHLKATPNLKDVTLIIHEHLGDIENPSIACRRAIWDQEHIAGIAARYCRKGRPLIVRRVLDGQISSFKLHVKRVVTDEWKERQDMLKLKYDWDNQNSCEDVEWPRGWKRRPGDCGLDCGEEEEEEDEDTFSSIANYLEID